MARKGNTTVTLDIRYILEDVAKQANKELAKELRLWARTAKRNVTRASGLKQLNQKVADKARERVINSYESSSIGERKSYRYNDRGKFRRYANGRMEKALRDPKTITADEHGIKFIDASRMDYWAKQWYRLNFGTKGGNNKRAPSAQPMNFFGVQTGVRVSLDQYPASKDFRIPKGFFSMTFAPKTAGTKLRKPRGANDAFYAARKDKRQRAIPSKTTPFFSGKASASISGQRFLDSGASYINAYYGRQFAALARSWLEIK